MHGGIGEGRGGWIKRGLSEIGKMDAMDVDMEVASEEEAPVVAEEQKDIFVNEF